MPGQYLYNVEFTVDDFDLWSFPNDLVNPEELPTHFRFQMKPDICLEISEEEFIDQVNCETKVTKNAMFSMSEQQVKNEVNGEILVCKSKCPGNDVLVGHYKMPKFNYHFKQLMEMFEKQSEGLEKKCGKSDPCADQPCSDVIKELVQLLDKDEVPSGSLQYTVQVTCFGSTFSISRDRETMLKEKTIQGGEMRCFEEGVNANPKHDNIEFDEYSAEVNGNQLIIRVRKDDRKSLVTQVFDTDIDQDGNEIQHDKNVLSICGCDQQVDFKFPANFECGKSKKKPTCCDCGSESSLTKFQRQTSCIGKSFKNSCGLPVIRGNLKYPGRLDGSIKLDLYNKCNPRDATEKYKKKPPTSRSACAQVDDDNLKRELQGNCKIPKGIEVCDKGCTELDSDVFVLKIGSKKTNKTGSQSAIELEMRTPKGPDFEVKKKETREVQVDEKEFDECKKTNGKKSADGSKVTKGFVKKQGEVKNPKGGSIKKK